MFSPFFYHYHPIFKIAWIFVIIIHFFFMAIVGFKKFSISQPKQYQSIVIDRITAEKQQYLVNVQCSGQGIIKALAADTLDIRVNIRKKETLFEEVYIKNIDTLSENTLIIGIQPPLKDARYGIGKRDIEVQFKTEKETVEISRTVVLGTATQRLDLRAYTISNPEAYMRNGILLFLGLSAAFVLLIPLLKKYNFKKQAIKKYKDITAEDKPELDPFTFEAFEEKDEVIVVDDNIMLLRSWKRLNAMKEDERDETFAPFFEDTEKSHLFKPLTHPERSVNRVWFGMTGAYIAWLFYVLLMRFDFETYRAWLSAVFDTTSKQFSDVIYADLLLAAALGLGMGSMFLTADLIYKNHSFSVVKTLYRIVSGLLILSMFFVLQFLINIYLINNNFLGQLVTWICIGLGLAFSFRRHKDRKKNLIAAGITALAGFVTWQLCSLDVFLNILNPQMTLLISLLISGSILGGLTYNKAAIQQDKFDEESTAATDRTEALTVHAGEL